MKLCIFCVVNLMIITCFGQNKEQLEEQFDSLAKNIRQSTYYDSSSVFSYGDSAIKIARELKDLSREALIYQYYGNYYYFSRKKVSSAQYYIKSKKLAKKNEDWTLYNTTLIREAFILVDSDSYTAEKQFKELLEKSIERGDGENIVECYNGLGIISESRSNRNDAMDYYLKALKSAEKIDSKYHISMMLNNIGLIKFYNKQYEEAEKDLQRGLKYAEELGEERLAFNLHNNLGLISSEKGDFEAAREHYGSTLIKAENLGFPQGIGVTLLNLSNSYSELGKKDTALLYIDSAIHIFEMTGDYPFLPKAYFLKGSVTRSLGNYNEALGYVETGLEYADKVGSKQDEASGLRFKSMILKDLGRYEIALAAYEEFYSLHDSLAEVNNAEKMAELQVIYDLEKKDAEIELLAKDNALNNSRINIIIISSVSFLVLVLAFFHNRHVRLRRKQQRDYTQKLISNIDEERSRISRDLHDDIGQSLSVIKSKINLYRQGKIDNLDGLDGEVGEMINQTRNLSHTLHPSYLEKIGLVRSIASLAERVQKSSGIVCSYEVAEAADDLPLEIQTQVYRIVQESINNTIKHANASALKIILVQQGGYYQFEYMDNGRGFTEKEISDGIGLNTIRERALKIGGRAIFSDNRGKGFRCVIRFE
ncbi:sensor histidine kinase [Wandonia haliotis]